MQEVVDGGIVPDLWKIEGVPTREGSALVGQKTLTIGGHARCLVLGRAADTETVASWLTLAGTTPGYQGFAVGRTIWHEPVVAWLRNHDDDALVAQIAERYLALVAAFRS
jgi:myo-inositol catabolism protein IolC